MVMNQSALALPDLHDKRAVLLETLDDPKSLEAWLLDTMQRGEGQDTSIAWIRAVWVYSLLVSDSAVDLHRTRGVDLAPIFSKALDGARSKQLSTEVIDLEYALFVLQDKLDEAALDRLVHEAGSHHLPDSHARMRAVKALYLIGKGDVSAGTRLMNELTQELDGKLDLKDYELLVLKNYIALGLYHLDQNDKAIRLLDEVDTLATQLNLRWFRLPILHNLGRAWLRSSEGEEAALRAKPYVEKQLSLAREFHMPWDEAMALVSLALVEMRSKEWDRALHKARRAIAIFAEVGDRLRQAEAEAAAAQIETKRQNWDAALPFALQALEHASNSDYKRPMLQLHENLYEIYKAKGQIKDALRHLEQHAELHKGLAAEREKNEFRKMTVTMGLALEEDRNRNQAKELASQKRMNRWQTLAVLFLTLGAAGIVLAYLRIRKVNQQIAALNSFIRTQVLSRFLPPELVQEISEGRSRFQDAAERCEVTVLFADLCSFTRATEHLGAETVATILNHFLASMTDVIFRYGGTIDKFMGDGIMVIFGAPTHLSIAEQAQRAAACAASMMQELERLNHGWLVDFQWEFQMRIGVNQGVSIVGTFGGDRRADYTVVGSAVNIASRVEGEAEPNQILLTSTVARHLQSRLIQPAGSRQLRGVSAAVEVFALTMEADEKPVNRAG
ncbi:adenylate/guanylate cyclase domain-containing protein [Oligoflexus sp.]|uniref:adenylate/guanylate cyclase domain-containing protein n=1 Tax=Oligoflexus sp. TaxID=1971216 RepID=UPI002D76D3CC|nr:adenylate/guanylate cyclase domain-containing protein [Oligoflexus sp.]